MALRSSIANYGTLARFLHWVTAVVIIGLFALGVYMHELPQGNDAEVARKVWLFSLHKTFGMLAFALAVIRLCWALANPKPHPLKHAPPRQVFVAETVHWMLYAGILITPLAGYLHHLGTAGSAPIWLPVPQSLPFIPQTLGFSQLAGMLHFISAVLMALSIFLHVAGALFHAFVIKDDTLARMIPFLRTRGSELGAPAPEQTPRLAAFGLFAGVLLIGGAVFSGGTREDGKPLLDMKQASSWEVDYDDSLLEIRILQMGELVTGQFADWKTFIVFDPDDLQASKITTVIDVSSLEIGMATEQALSNEFLNIGKFSTAIWTSSDFSLLDDGRYRANGTLAIKGLEVPSVMDFNLSIEDDDAVAEGIAQVNRNDFGLGSVTYPTEESLGFSVRVRAVIEAEREEP